MRYLFWIDGIIFRVIRAWIRQANRIFNFDAKICARFLFFVYLLTIVNALAFSNNLYKALIPVAVIILSIVPRIERLGRPRASLEQDSRSCILRLSILTIFWIQAAVDPISDGGRWIPPHVIWPILMYVLDLDSQDKGERRVVLPSIAAPLAHVDY